jgi:hypothetical chaperone protein
MATACGIDFGTSNSSAGIMQGKKPYLICLEEKNVSIPSAIFYPSDGTPKRFGRNAIRAYTAQEEGRLLRSLKSILGSPLMDDTTLAGGARKSFKSILGEFLCHLKRCTEAHTTRECDAVVLGRPVHFVDHHPQKDALAQAQLEEAARAQGFKHIHFQYEPIAAALDYEQAITREEIALIADIGGGTSDFSIVRVSPQRKAKAERTQDVLANSGVHVGGTDLDCRLSMAQVMPALGYKTRQEKRRELEIPSHYYFELAQWHRIVFLYTPKTLLDLEQLRRSAHEPEKIERLIRIVRDQEGHRLAGEVEAAKMRLSGADKTVIDLEDIQKGWAIPLLCEAFEEAVAAECSKITASIRQCIALSGLTPERIDTLFLTGGSTMIPCVKAACFSPIPHARVISGDVFGSVGVGLTLDAHAKFGT